MPEEWRTLSPKEWKAVREAAETFEKALASSPTAELEEFLPPAGNALRANILHELVKVELAHRWQHGRGLLLEQYVKKYPELGPLSSLSPDLVYVEFRARHNHGDRPPLETYRLRFPEQFADLERRVQAEPASHDRPVAPTQPAGKGLRPAAANVHLDFGGGYTLLERLGSGAFGEVWRARGDGGGFEVAIKIIFRSVEHQDVQQELQALEAIREVQHPFLLSTHSFWFFADRLYIVMELAKGGSLGQRLKTCQGEGLPAIPEADFLRYAREAAEAVDFLHSQTVMHRDIKPENILLHQGHVKLADFGMARSQADLLSIQATISGTPLYMPPEVWNSKLSPHSDQYSLAVTYAELRLGRRPFKGGSLVDLMREHLEGRPDLEGLSQAEQDVFLKALAKESADRYPTCQQFVEDLQRAVASTKPAPVPPPTPDIGWRRRLLLYAAVVLLLLFPVGVVGHQLFGLSLWESSSISIELPGPVRLHAGKHQTIFVGLKRVNYSAPVPLKWKDLPGDIQFELGEMVVPEQAPGLQLTLIADDNAQPRKIALTVEGPGTSAVLDLEILPLDTLPLPSICRRADDTTIVTDRRERKYYKSILRILPDGTEVPFLAVPEARPTDPPTFYIMRDKVSNGLFGRFARPFEQRSAALSGASIPGYLSEPMRSGALQASLRAVALEPQWRLGGKTTRLIDDQLEEKDIGAADPNLPVLRVTALEAHRFAQWLGGRLPSTKEWDRAAGRFEENPRQGPFRGVWHRKPPGNQPNPSGLGIDRKHLGPMALVEPTSDVSPYWCQHMSGNGEEWTDTVFLPQEGTVSEFADRGFPPRCSVYLRGRSYCDTVPLLFGKMEQNMGSHDPREPKYDIGFRVVLPP